MFKPIMPYPPSEYEYRRKTARKYIYSYTEFFDEYREEDEDEKGPENDPVPATEVTLDLLMKRIPEGINPKQIKIEFGFNASSMSLDDHYVKFYYEVEIPARPDDFLADCKKYEEEMEKYKIDLANYKEFMRQEEIKEAEECSCLKFWSRS